MDLSSPQQRFGEGRPDEPAVILRLSLMAANEATGEPRLVASFRRKSSMPPALANPNLDIALELHGERRVLKPKRVTWDETHRLCIVDVEWLVVDERVADEVAEAASCPA